MTVFYDHQAFSLQDYGGITRIFSELKTGIDRSNNHAHLSLLYSNNIHLKENNLAPQTVFRGAQILKRRQVLYTVNQCYNIYDILTSRFDIYHPTYYNPGLIKYAKHKPVVATFHDMINEKFAGKFRELRPDDRLIREKKEMAAKATHIIAVSENTKKDLIEIYGTDPEKIMVIYLGNSFVGNINSSKVNSEKPYLLYVGNRGLYKNFVPFLKAIAPLLIRHKISFVCAGGKQFTKEEKDVIVQLNVGEYLIQEPVNDTRLAELYTNALAYVFPSLYEGFGIPVLEAFACNCPCILSNTSSLPEVAQNGAVYMDPYDPESMYHAVEMVVSDSAIRDKLAKDGGIRLKNFSWAKHVTETLDLYNDILKK